MFCLMFFFSGIEMLFTGKEKALKIKFWIVSTHAVKIWDHLNEKLVKLLWNEMIMKWDQFFINTSNS